MGKDISEEAPTKGNLEGIVFINYDKIRDCLDYKTEYDDCKSFRGRFNQYFVEGEFSDCSDHKKDFRHCNDCYGGNTDACLQLVKRADEILKRRMEAHNKNDVWKKRSEPPKDWNKPLPDFLAEKSKNSFKSLGMKESLMDYQICVIM